MFCRLSSGGKRTNNFDALGVAVGQEVMIMRSKSDEWKDSGCNAQLPCRGACQGIYIYTKRRLRPIVALISRNSSLIKFFAAKTLTSR
jgi:hypothetical protein